MPEYLISVCYKFVPGAFFQEIWGLGNPSALHSILASFPWAKALSVGSTIQRGGTNHCIRQKLNVSFIHLHSIYWKGKIEKIITKSKKKKSTDRTFHHYLIYWKVRRWNVERASYKQRIYQEQMVSTRSKSFNRFSVLFHTWKYFSKLFYQLISFIFFLERIAAKKSRKERKERVNSKREGKKEVIDGGV